MPTNKSSSGRSVEATVSAVEAPGRLDIEQLVRDYYQPVYRYAYRLTGNESDAADATQQTFLIAHSKLKQLREVQRVQSWLFAVLRSCFLKSRRRRRPTVASNVELDVNHIPELTREDDIDRERLQQALNDLHLDHRLVLMMFYFEQASYQDIAEALAIPLGTVMSRLARAKGRLRQALLRGGVQPSPPPVSHWMQGRKS